MPFEQYVPQHQMIGSRNTSVTSTREENIDGLSRTLQSLLSQIEEGQEADDEIIHGFLRFVSAKFELWRSNTELEQLWTIFFYPTLSVYRKLQSDGPVSSDRAKKRFDKICKLVAHFYTKLPNKDQAIMCHLGDIARYRHQTDRATSYYVSAQVLSPNTAGTALNQLGNLSYGVNDFLTAIFFFLKALAVEVPFNEAETNLRVVGKKLMKTRITDDTVLQILQLLSSKVSKSTNVDLRNLIQDELTTELSNLVRKSMISLETLVKIVIIGITQDWRGQQYSAELTNMVVDKVLSASFYLLSEKDESLYNPILAMLRVYLAWIRKQQQPLHFGQKLVAVLELLRVKYGFKFDILTAVGRSNWYRFKEEDSKYLPLPTQQELNDIDSNASASLEPDGVGEYFEETQCAGLLSVDGGLDDIPSGMEEGLSTVEYRVQCILYSGIEISRFGAEIYIDEFCAHPEFKYVTPELDEHAVSPPSTVSGNSTSGNHIVEPVKDLEFLKISREELERKQALFMQRPGSSARLVNASASPQFLKKLRQLEFRDVKPKKNGNKKATTTPKKQENGGSKRHSNSRVASGKTDKSNSVYSRSPNVYNSRPVDSIEFNEDEADDDDDEEIVYAGRSAV